jgi:purine-binding chemotaxis protein CheW
VVTAVDARRRLGLRDRRDEDPVANIVIRMDGEPVSLMVDAEGDVIVVDGEAREDVPETVSAMIRAYTVGAFKTGRSLLLVVDPDELLSIEGT